MTPDINYSEARGYNLGIARDLGLNAAVVYNQLAFWQGIKGKGKWFYKSYEEMTAELPLSEKQIRNAYLVLVEHGMIETAKKKIKGSPVMHFRVYMRARFGNLEVLESDKSAVSKESDKSSETINNKEPEKNSQAAEQQAALLVLVNKHTGRSFRTLPARGTSKLLKDFTLDELSSALAALAADPWHKDMLSQKKLSIEYLIRPTTIDKFLQVAQRTPAPAAAYTGPTSAPKKVWGDENVSQ